MKLLSRFICVLAFLPSISFAQAPNLGAAASFTLFTAAGAINNTGNSVITGDIGTDAGAFNGFPPGKINGTSHVADATSSAASAAVFNAYSSLSATTCGVVLTAALGNGQTLTPNVYCNGAASTLNGNLTLDAQGDPNALFVFKINGAFATSAASNVILINGANINHVFWQLNGEFDLGAGSTFRGVALVTGAINLLSGSSIYGKALSRAGAINLYDNIANSVVATIPTVSATNFVFNSTDATTLSSSYTIGNGTNRVVVASTSPIIAFSATASLLSTVAIANATYGRGAGLGGGYVVYNGIGNSAVVAGLTANTKYYFAVVEYNAASPNNATLSSYLLSSTTTLADTDGDGVADIYDAYPKDAKRAFNTYSPSGEYGTYLFEDNWPGTGDYDFNDLVMGYKYNTVTNAANQVVELKATLVVNAAGATFQNAFGLQLDGLSPQLVTSVVGTDTKFASWLTTSANGTEANQTYANVIVVDNISRVLTSFNTNLIVNTIVGAPYVSPDTINVTITFAENQVLPSAISVNPYLIINQNRSRELHMANKVPTSAANISYFGSNDDKSVPASGIYYVNKNNLPWALDMPATMPYPMEGVNITSAYLNQVNWAQSGGKQFTDWYSNTRGYRNMANMYTH